MSLPTVNVITPHGPGRDLHRIRGLISAQTYTGPLVHTVVYDGPPYEGSSPHDILLPEQHHDRGSFAVNYAVRQATADLCLQIADDDWIAVEAIEKLVLCWLAKPVDFVHPHMPCFSESGDPAGCVTGDPPEKWNLTSGLFRPELFWVANMLCGPTGEPYTQPGADGMMVYDWLQAGRTMTILPERVVYHYGG